MPDPLDNQRDFFVSFNKDDREWASWIAFELEAAGHSVYFQDWDFQPGNNFILKMHEAARQTRATVAVLSPSFLKSEFAATEWAAALVQDPTGAQRKLVGARVRQCKPDGLLAALVYIDLVGLNEEAAAEALRDGVTEGRRKPKSISFPGTRERKRFPGALPTRWNVGPRNPNYLDRDNLLARLHAALSSGTTAALTQAIAGLGGVGKSTLAREYAHVFAGEYDTVWEIRSETSVTLTGDLASLGREVQVADIGMQELDAAKAAISWLRSQQRWLLIFDNAVNLDDVKPWLPGGTAGRVLITSRNPNFRGVGQTLEVKVFSPEHGAKFLADRTGVTTEPAAARQLSEVLGGLPLALELAAKYIEEKRTTITKYLELLPKHQGKLLAPVADAFRVSVIELSPESRRLLQQLSFLAADDVPRSFLMGEDELEFDEALAGLIKFSLTLVREDGLFTHRLLQAAVRNSISEAGPILDSLADGLREEFGYDYWNLATWPAADRIFPHVLSLVEHMESARLGIESETRLLDDAASYAQLRIQDLAQALRLATRALSVSMRVWGPADPKIASRANRISKILHHQGDLSGALQYAELALTIEEKAFGASHERVAIRATAVAQILSSQGNHAGALATAERALAIDQARFGLEHPRVAADENEIAMILLDIGDLSGAQEHAKSALEIDQKRDRAGENPNVARDLYTIARILQAKGELDGSLEHAQRALLIQEKKHGPDHHEVATLANYVGVLLVHKGDVAGAVAYTQRGFAILHGLFGADHPMTRAAKNRLATVKAGQSEG